MNRYTRKIEREYLEVMFEGVVPNADGEFVVSPINVQRANDYLVGAMHGLTIDQVNELDPAEHKKLLAEAQKAKAPLDESI